MIGTREIGEAASSEEIGDLMPAVITVSRIHYVVGSVHLSLVCNETDCLRFLGPMYNNTHQYIIIMQIIIIVYLLLRRCPT